MAVDSIPRPKQQNVPRDFSEALDGLKLPAVACLKHVLSAYDRESGPASPLAR